MTPKLIKQISSGELYVWTAELAAREGFEEVGQEVATPEPVQEEQVDEQQPEEQVEAVEVVEEVAEIVKPAKKSNGNKVKG